MMLDISDNQKWAVRIKAAIVTGIWYHNAHHMAGTQSTFMQKEKKEREERT